MWPGAGTKTSLTPIAVAVDRHGSLIWEAGGRFVLNVFVTLAITDASPGFLVELWIVADDNERYTRRLLEQLMITTASSIAEFGDGVPSVERMVARAAEVVALLSRDDLTDAYPLPHGPNPTTAAPVR